MISNDENRFKRSSRFHGIDYQKRIFEKQLDLWQQGAEAYLNQVEQDILEQLNDNETLKYNGKTLSAEDRQKIINVLKAVFPEYH